MAIHPIDYRYGSQEMRDVFDEKKKLDNMLRVEAALAETLADFEKIPRESAEEIKRKANTNDVKLERVKEIEKETKHDVMAIVKALTEVCGEAGKYVHLTATSYDIVDTANALMLKDGLEILLNRGKDLLRTCLDISEKYKNLTMIGRTHGQHATPITLGFKFANYSNKLGEDLVRLEYDIKNYILGKFSGAVGSYASQELFGLGNELEIKVMEKLGIPPAEISMQVVERESFARIICDIAILACTIEQISKEIRNLQRTEIGELSESFGEKQVGSSTMAQKRNPINTENICSNVRIIRSCVYPSLEDIALEHERDLTNSAAERSLIPTAFILADEILVRMNKILKELVVYPDNIKKNLDLSKGTIMSEAIMTKLVEKGMGRQDAHELLRESSMKAFESGKHLRDVLLTKNIGRYLSPKELEKLFDYNNYTGLCVEKTEKIVSKWRGFV